MKIWITRPSAFQLQCGGIDRLRVWFRKPVWTESKFIPEKDLMFGSYMSDGCFVPNGWGVHGGAIQNSISLGAAFGYDNELSNDVWLKLNEHFGNTDMREWDIYEKNNVECSIQNFILSYNIGIILDT